MAGPRRVWLVVFVVAGGLLAAVGARVCVLRLRLQERFRAHLAAFDRVGQSVAAGEQAALTREFTDAVADNPTLPRLREMIGADLGRLAVHDAGSGGGSSNGTFLDGSSVERRVKFAALPPTTDFGKLPISDYRPRVDVEVRYELDSLPSIEAPHVTIIVHGGDRSGPFAEALRAALAEGGFGDGLRVIVERP